MKSEPAKRAVGRPQKVLDGVKITVTSGKAKSRLQTNSERRAIINAIIDAGGALTLEQLDEHFGFDMRQSVLSLITAGWLTQEVKK